MNSKFLMAVSVIALAGAMAPAFADTSPAKTAQQNKMTVCNQQAGGMKGDERKAFMSNCLKAAPAPMTQQDKMKHCNTAATGKAGDERKAFMSQCLKKSS